MEDIRNKIWGCLVDCRFKTALMGYKIQRFQKIDRSLNLLLAIASSGSIAAWAIWNYLPLLWGAIIAFSQVIQVIKPYFPYSKYIKILNDKSKEMQSVNLRFEMLFYELDHHEENNKIIEKKYFALKQEANNICFFSDDSSFSFSDNDVQKANEESKNYLKQNYNVECKI